MNIVSPCISVCRMDAANRYCEGCLRTLDEIAAWATSSDVQKRAVLANVAQRRLERAATVVAKDGRERS